MRACIIITGMLLSAVICLPVRALSSDDNSDADKAYRVVLVDGSTIIGKIQSENPDSLKLVTLSGVSMTIERDKISKLIPLSGSIVGGVYRRTDPNYTRLLYSSTARSLKHGQGYISLYELFFPFAAIGIMDFITFGAGISLLPGIEEQLFFLAPKVTFLHAENLDLAGGILNISLLGDQSSEGIGIIYGVGTFGSRFTAATIGLGWGYAGDETTEEPIVMLGGELQVSNSFKLITENWFPPYSDFALLMFGFRFFGERFSSDIGFMRFTEVDLEGWPFFPWVNFVYNFGNAD